MRQISKNVHDDLQGYINLENNELIKSGFSAVNNIYVLTLPTANKTYCFNTKGILPDGSAKTTTWSTIKGSYFESKERKFYMGENTFLAEYSGYYDNTTRYRITYYSSWVDFGSPLLKSIIKKIKATVICRSNQSLVFKWAYDFSTNYFSDTATVTTVGGIASDYGVAQYSIGEYSGTAEGVSVVEVNCSSSGQLFQFGIEIEPDGTSLSIQKIDIFSKDGRY